MCIPYMSRALCFFFVSRLIVGQEEEIRAAMEQDLAKLEMGSSGDGKISMDKCHQIQEFLIMFPVETS